MIAVLSGNARSLLSAERVALNFLGHLSGVASATARLVAAARETAPNAKARITCTRKTLPGLRALQKQAVVLGGGFNHRFGLDDAMLIKDNHIIAAGSVGKAIKAARAHAGHMVKIEIEVDTLDELRQALSNGAEVVLLDNMTPAHLAEAVKITAGRAVLEASGNVTEATIGAIAATGVDYISSGAITHSAKNLDIGLDFEA
jgi:nicotinate-nucleotide pyrophosphorylase (carboxylating)